MNHITKICCFCERWESGGIESLLCNILMRFDFTQLQVDIAVASMGESIFTKRLQEHGVRFIELSGSQRNVVQNRRLFRTLLKQQQYDVLHLNAFHGLSLAYLQIAKEVGVPIRIAHSHNTALRRSSVRLLKLMLHVMARARYTKDATDLWACSLSAAKFLFSKRILDTKGFIFIPNGIDTERFRFDSEIREQIRTGLGLNRKFVVGNVGRFCYQKNQSFLISVFAELVKRQPDSTLLLVGEGEDKSMLKQKAKRLDIAEKVIFYGTCKHVEQLYWAMDAFVFPSRFEGLGIAVVEAQAAGVPVICSENIPHEALITDQVMQISLSDGIALWAQAIRKCGEDKADRFTGMRQAVAAGYDIWAVVERVRKAWIE